MELNLAKDVRDNKKSFFKYISSKRKIKESGFSADRGGCPRKTQRR